MNFIFFGSLSKKITQVEGELHYAQALISQVDSLSNQLEEKQFAIEKTGPNRDSRLSFYADEIGGSLSPGIKLIQLNIFPAIKESRLSKKMGKYELGKIQIKGENKNGLQLNDWIVRLEQFEWVERVRLQPYKAASNIGEFEVVIELY